MIMPRVFFPALFATALAGCHANEDALYGKVFSCSPGAKDSQCGTSASGGPMMCFAGTQLGSENSCVEKCASDVTPGSPDESGMVCLSSDGVRVPTCKPSAAVGCPLGLSCYRTDLLSDQGVCLNIRVCSENTDCPDPARRSCLSTIADTQYQIPTLQTSNLHCLQEGCKARGAACPSGEACLPLVLPATTRPPDICVPNCVNLNCPPNFVCWRRVGGLAAADVCIPGVIGFRCTNDMDCLMGDCVDTGVGFRVCSTPCSQDQDCLPFSSSFGLYICVDSQTGRGKHCLTPRAFNGAFCTNDSLCDPGLHCFYWSPSASPLHPNVMGECRVACNDDGSCPARAGIPHACITGGNERSCLPGTFGVECTDDSQCVANLPCLPIPPSDAGAPGGRICSIPCAVDLDCDLDPRTGKGGFCEEGLCRVSFQPDEPCSRDAQCLSRDCLQGVCGPQ